MDSPKMEKRRKPIFAPMKIKVEKADPALVPESKTDLALDRLKAAPQAFDGSLIADPANQRDKDAPIITAEAPVVPVAANEEATVAANEEAPAEVTIAAPKAAPIQSKEKAIMDKFKAQDDAEVYSDPYKIKTPPPAWVPPTRRGFTKFFDSTFAQEGEFAAQFTLRPKPVGAKDLDACKKAKGKAQIESFLYQQFVREYLRSETPYRGLLVYHGLGSGKTCTSISAAEALFSSAKKRVIVITPASLRPNYQSEISKCGFRHFRLKNLWQAINLDKLGPIGAEEMTIKNFATEVIGIPESYYEKIKRNPPGRRNIWVPDFEGTPNFDSLDPESQTDIQAQILAVIDNRIQFINWNGISRDKLKEMVCTAGQNPDKPGPFDNAVIVIDEIHNLSNLMRGILHPFMEEIPGKKGGRPRLIAAEPVTPERWRPGLCNLNKNYEKGFLLYRLIAEARNSKVIGLSGTPLINFPDELGPLINMIGGYTHAMKFILSDKSESTRNIFKSIINKHLRTDFVEFTPGQMDVQVIVTTFPDGYVKVLDGRGEFMGVREDEEEGLMTTKEVAAELFEAGKKAGINFKSEPTLLSYPILPINPMEFNKYFVNTDTLKPENINTLKKRMYGLVSYYKGASEDFLPTVISDEIVDVELSEYALQYYTKRRLKELAERPKDLVKGNSGEIDPYDEIVQATSGGGANYRANSRMACNFAFPTSIKRPYRSVKKEEEFAQEVEEKTIIYSDQDFEATAIPEVKDEEALINATNVLIKQLGGQSSEGRKTNPKNIENLGFAPDGTRGLRKRTRQSQIIIPGPEESPEEVPAEVPEEVSDEIPEEISQEVPEEVVEEDILPVMKNPELDEESYQTSYEEVVEDTDPKYKKVVQEFLRKAEEEAKEAGFTTKLDDEELGTAVLEPFEIRLQKALQTLRLQKQTFLKINGTPDSNLQKFSPKYTAMIKNIEDFEQIPGSSLVYSMFNTAEGLTCFGYALEANGYVNIELTGSKSDPALSSEAEASLRKGPSANEKRFAIFSGSVSFEHRKVLLKLFNGVIDELPPKIQKVMIESGWQSGANMKGELCKVFCITTAGAEGISLMNVRGVHIMEPFWNDVKTEQVKGRAVRICSHQNLPPDQRNVRVFTYIVKFTEEQLRGKQVIETLKIKDKGETSDQFVNNITLRKRELNKGFLKILKEVAIDCPLNFADNEKDLRCYQGVDGNPSESSVQPSIATNIQEGEIEERVAKERAKKAGPVEAAAEIAAPVRQRQLIRVGGKEYYLARDPSTDDPNIMLAYDIMDVKQGTPLLRVTIDPSTGLPRAAKRI